MSSPQVFRVWFAQKGALSLALLLVLPAFFIQLGSPQLEARLRYDRQAILDGELWRLLTGHFVHLGWTHLAFNMAGLLLLVIGFSRNLHLSLPRTLSSALVLTLAISLAFLVNHPELTWYVGLSGLLHGLALLIAAAMWRQGKLAGLFLLMGLLGKVVWEQIFGASASSTEVIGGAVVVDAHFYGVVFAAVIALSAFTVSQARSLIRTRD